VSDAPAEQKVIERARIDLAAGEAWRARTRLEGALVHRPADQAILSLLAEVCFSMSDLPAAGRYWFLTDAEGADVEAAFAAMNRRFRGATALWANLPAHPGVRIDDYPEQVRRRLCELAEAAGSMPPPAAAEPWTAPATSWLDRVLLPALVSVWLLGLATLVYLAYRVAAAVF
jgi:hypothetical protein